MNTLYVLREEPGAVEYELLGHAENGDGVLLLQDAVHASDKIDGGVEVYSCHYDLEIRELESGTEVTVDYDDIADMLEEYDRVISL